jgi:hypothetical protein
MVVIDQGVFGKGGEDRVGIKGVHGADILGDNEVIAAHLRRLENDLARTQEAVASLRDLLEYPTPVTDIGRRKVGSLTAAAISEVVHMKDALCWFSGALGGLLPQPL